MAKDRSWFVYLTSGRGLDGWLAGDTPTAAGWPLERQIQNFSHWWVQFLMWESGVFELNRLDIDSSHFSINTHLIY